MKHPLSKHIDRTRTKEISKERKKSMETMNMMRGEIVLNMNAGKAWGVLTSNDKLSKVNPLMLSSAEYIQGDGAPGSLRLFKLGPGIEFF